VESFEISFLDDSIAAILPFDVETHRIVYCFAQNFYYFVSVKMMVLDFLLFRGNFYHEIFQRYVPYCIVIILYFPKGVAADV
jgi:hypothetical protein